MFFFIKLGLVTCGFFLLCCLLLDLLWFLAGSLLFESFAITVMSWWAYCLLMSAFWLFSWWLAFRLLVPRIL